MESEQNRIGLMTRPEVPDEALHRPRRTVGQGADGVTLNLLGQFPQQINLFRLGVALN